MAIRILLGGRYKIATLQGERIAAPVCGLARNDRGNGTLQGENGLPRQSADWLAMTGETGRYKGKTDCHASVRAGSQ